jgi:hypothetical protein
LTFAACGVFALSSVHGYAFVARKQSPVSCAGNVFRAAPRPYKSSGPTSSSLQMIDQQMIMGGAIAVTGLIAGIGLVAFTEQQGERAKARGGGLSEGMATRITGQLMEDVEVSSVSDLGSLTSQLEEALRQTGAAAEDELQFDEEEQKRIAELADDGW